MNRPGPFDGYWLLLFTCQDCSKECVRLTRTDPELVWRCMVCEPVAVRQVSERILATVFGNSDWRSQFGGDPPRYNGLLDVVSVLHMPRRDEIGSPHYAILGLQAMSPRHGYELGPYFAPAGELGLVCTMGLPLLYATLHRAEELGYAVAEESLVSQGPPRKVFRLTSSGCHALDEWLRTPLKQVPLIRQEFLLKLFFVRHLPQYDQLDLLTVQIRACEMMLSEIREAQQGAEPSSFAALVHDSHGRVLEATTAWLSEQLAVGCGSLPAAPVLSSISD